MKLKRLVSIAISIVVIALASPLIRASSQDKAKTQPQEPQKQTEAQSFTLTEDEQRELAAVVSAGRAADNELNQAVQSARAAKIEAADAIAVLAKIKLAFEHVDAAASRYAEVLDRHRRAHGCRDCEYGDGKTLVKPRPRK